MNEKFSLKAMQDDIARDVESEAHIVEHSSQEAIAARFQKKAPKKRRLEPLDKTPLPTSGNTQG